MGDVVRRAFLIVLIASMAQVAIGCTAGRRPGWQARHDATAREAWARKRYESILRDDTSCSQGRHR